MKGSEIREAFLKFFEGHGHRRVPSASLLPKDKTLLFNIAGMVPFKPYFLGEVAPPYARAVSSQKCIRTNDIDRVGTTARHLTFFEMLGNFSFGDYFKREAIGWGWEFLTAVLGLPNDRLYVSVYEKDDEAHRLWREIAGLSADRIVRLGKEHNFWEVGPTGPCGPCSEILYDQGPSFSCGRPACAPGCDCDRYMEVWNLVFMEFNQAGGEMHPLPKKNIDTGMGLERLAAVLQNKRSNFETDLLYPIIESARSLSAAGVSGADRKSAVALNVVADHMRAATFLLSDGLRPSNEDRGYVLRRLIRRASASMRKLGVTGPALSRLVPVVVDLFGQAYPELAREQESVTRELQAEEERFAKTLDIGMERLTQATAELRRAKREILPGEEAFVLYDTYGFPLELTEEVLREDGMRVDRAGFDREMEAQKARARAAFQAAHSGAEAIYMSVKEPTRFVGYESLESDAEVLRLVREGQFVDDAREGDAVEILFDRTPFYAERGGQVGDEGLCRGGATEVRVESCFPVGQVSVHRATVVRGHIRPGDRLHLDVDAARRQAIMKNHTGTHLLHAALRQILGDHVHQAGSLVAPDRLRFDYTHGAALGEQWPDIETRVNRWILGNLEVRIQEMSMAEAQRTGAMMLFDEKYGDRVRVVQVGGGESVELCGGTHCRATGEIGLLKIVSDAALSAGVRRIEAVTGEGAVAYVQKLAQEVRAVERAVKSPLSEVPAMIEKMQKEKKDLEKKLKEARRGGVSADDFISKQERAGDQAFIVTEVPDADIETLRALAETLRDRISGPVFLASGSDGSARLVMAVPKPLAGRYHAGQTIRRAAPLVGGKGGGRPDFAQAGGKDVERIPEALSAVREILFSVA